MTNENVESSQPINVERLQELLRPVREVAAVWNIPLMEYLDSYLKNISVLDLSHDFNPEMLNFSQAGLFLQGTTSVYAKKVKHLYDLVTNSVSFSNSLDNDNENGDGTKNNRKKRKVAEYVIDDLLAPIDDPVECDTSKIKVDDDKTRYEVTTMPKIPFCLLNSLETKQTIGNSYRISNIPSQETGVILLDNSTDFKELNEFRLEDSEAITSKQRGIADSSIPSILDESNEIFGRNPPSARLSPNLPLKSINNVNFLPPQLPENEFELPPVPDNNDIISTSKKSTPERSDTYINGFPTPPDFGDENTTTTTATTAAATTTTTTTDGSNDNIINVNKEEGDFVELKKLNPDSTKLQFTSRPFKKMKKPKIPESFSGLKKNKNKSGRKKIMTKPFHNDIFFEIFDKIKSYRVKRMRDEDRQALEYLIPEESGRDHVLMDMDTYVEPPPQDIDMDNNELNLPEIDDNFLSTDNLTVNNGNNNDGNIDVNDNNENIDEMEEGIELVFNSSSGISESYFESYAQKCQNIIKNMIEMGQKQVFQNQTAQALMKWERHVTPILEKDLKNKPYVVPDVQEWIKDVISANERTIHFKTLVRDVPHFEVSRIFLAVLMLANAGAVKIDEKNPKMANDFLIRLPEDA